MYNREQCQADMQRLMGTLLGSDALPVVELDFFSCEARNVQVQLRLRWPLSPALWAAFQSSVAALRPTYDWALSYVLKPQARAILATQQAVPGVANVIGVAAGKGGVGKSTVAVAVARAWQRAGAKVGILDADVYGPSVPTLLGISDKKTTTKNNKFIPLVAEGIQVQSMASLVDADDALIWRGPMASKAVEQLAYQTAWPELDYLIVDLPPGTGDIALTVTKKLPLTAAILVSTAHALALADVQRCHAMLQKMNIPVLGLVDNMAYVSCPHCDQQHPLFMQQQAMQDWQQQVAVKTLASVPFSEDQPSAPIIDRLAAQMAAGLCSLEVRRGVHMPQVVSA